MKNQIIAIAALLAAAAAHAQTTPAQVYVTVAGGSTHMAVDCTGATTCDKTTTGGKALVGYSFGNGFSLEGGYASFGKAVAADRTSSATIKPTALLLGGAFALPLGNEWGMNVRLGLAQVKTKASAAIGTQRGSVSESEAKAYAGIGLTYAVAQNVKLELAADSTQGEIAGEKGTIRLISLGATFAF
ncbi:outer membrane beta-barrel protein [Roseateles asaccharophilus]|uniref:Outer membrane protein beta-barrel domain-containing protein n=1 Tax=Roseateles asaccharophilus TaxID=582607 RepID=A0ABU2AFF1_9BURK|nr:outer membrane beta-barrel protein [Roseateles asaccharophilus]MDR7335947.1 hypothetical protein [Roseateles asaccharophilus]